VFVLSYVKIEGLTKVFGGRPPSTAVKELDLEIEDGEFVVLLGPSGCGKTTTLRCLAGLESPTAGRISLNEQAVFDADGGVNLSPDRRSIGMVFQSYALWPHMTVRKNVAYPLRARGMKEQIKAGQVEAIAELVGCENLLDRYPAQLSGGQQQRVALARGLVAQPDLVLLDEPLSNLDARLRDSVRAQLHELHARLRFTAVLVTHDQSEALALGERLAIMRSGVLEQFDSPQHIFEQPATEYVADFVGMSNRLVCERRDEGWGCNGEPLAGEPLAHPRLADLSVAYLRLRPDDLCIGPAGSTPDPNTTTLSGKVVGAQYGGRHIDVVVSVGQSRLHARIGPRGWDSWERKLTPGEQIWVGFRASDARVYAEPDREQAPRPSPPYASVQP
jgi:iron(III) transport system ATP-binding protein